MLRPIAVSAVFETSPIGGVPQGDFLNAVATCACDAAEAWRRAQQAERRGGRDRAERWGPRTLDVDVVTGDAPIPPELVLPHPRAHERAFVLAAREVIDREAHLPGYGTVAVLLDRLDTSSVRRRDDLRLNLASPRPSAG